MANNPVIKGIELGDMDNMYTMYTSPKKPEPPEGFVDNTVRVFRLNPDGSKGELVRTMEAFPEGWDDPHKLREKGFQKQKEEVKEMPKKDIDFEAIVAKAKQIMTEQDVSLYKASGIVAQETGLHRTTVYNRATALEQIPEPEPATAVTQEPEREEEESAGNSVAPDLLFVNRHHAVAEEIACLLDRKRQDYGTGNIRKFGSHGVLVRVSDKVERLINLSKRDGSPNFESVDDTWKDIAGYAILALIELREGR